MKQNKNNGWIITAGADQLAIVGMDVCLGGAENLSAFEFGLFHGLQPSRLASDIFIEKEARVSAETALLKLVSTRAMLDAGLESDGKENPRLGVLFARGSSLAASVAGRMKPDVILPDRPADDPAHWILGSNRKADQMIDLSARGNPVGAGLAEASKLLAEDSVDAVLLSSAVLLDDLAQLLEMASGKIFTGPATPGFDRGHEGWSVGEGAAALVLMRYDIALAEGKRIYAVLDGFAWAEKDLAEPKKQLFPTLLSSETILQSCQQAFGEAKIETGRVGYLEVLGSGFTPVDIAEITGLTRAYASAGEIPGCAVGSIQTQAGYLFNTSGLLALVKTALCLYHRLIPKEANWFGPKKPELWQNTPFYVAPETQSWFLTAGDKRRTAAVNAIGWDGSCVHLLLSEEISQQNRPNRFLIQSPFFLFPVTGDNLPDFSTALSSLQQDLLSGTTDLAQIAKQKVEIFQNNPQALYAAAIVGHDREEIQREIEHALQGIPAAFEKRSSWQTPLGSCFTADPAGREGGVAFVYPGAFNSYLGLGRDLFLLFPQLYEPITQLTQDLSATIHDDKLYPRTLEALSKEQAAELEGRLISDPIAMMTTGSLMAVLFTMIVRDIFKVQPSAAMGYSLGEIAMMFGTGVWSQADAISTKLRTMPLFHTRLSGPQNAVRACWGLPPRPADLPSDGLWSNYFLMAPFEKVRDALIGEDRVYLTHTNTPRQVVIGGDPVACQRIIASLKCTSLKAPFDFALHCEAIRSEYADLVDLHHWPVATIPDCKLYSAADNQPIPMQPQGNAEKIATMLCRSLDFPALVKQVYADGARVFIELGANSNCSKWIDETLKGSTYAAIPINRRGADDQTSIVRMLAKLAVQRVPVDLSPLYAFEKGIR